MYLNDWYWWDKPFIDRLGKEDKSERLEALHDAAKFYKVTRNFKKVKENNRLELALNLLEDVQEPVDSKNIDKAVNDLSEALKAEYGRSAISASSKFLWLRFKSPVIIYDSRALGWLTANGFKPSDRSYSSFRENWLKVFQEKEQEIKSSCADLHAVKEYSHANTATDSEIQQLVSETWFHERVFDKYLWFYGNGG